MKDATGELSMTAIAVVAIAAIALLFQQFVWPGIQNTIQRNTYCSQYLHFASSDIHIPSHTNHTMPRHLPT